MVPVAFSWGYAGWGTHTRELVELVDAVEARRGFEPPHFVDIRLRRQVRAVGFREAVFEKLVGTNRYTWLAGLGNRAIGDEELDEAVLDDPTQIETLLSLITEKSAQNRRIIFFCSCASPGDRNFCHRGLVVKALVSCAKRRKQSLTVQEWPGGAPVIASLSVSAAELKWLSRQRFGGKFPITRLEQLAALGALPHSSVVRFEFGEDRLLAKAAPAIYTAKGWVLPFEEVHTIESLPDDLLASCDEDRAGFQLETFGTPVKEPRWRDVDL